MKNPELIVDDAAHVAKDSGADDTAVISTDPVVVVGNYLSRREPTPRPPDPEHVYVDKEDGTLYGATDDFDEELIATGRVQISDAMADVHDWQHMQCELMRLIVGFADGNRKVMGTIIDWGRGIDGWTTQEVEAAWISAVESKALWREVYERERFREPLGKLLSPEQMHELRRVDIDRALKQASALRERLHGPESSRSRVDTLRPQTLHDIRKWPKLSWLVKNLIPAGGVGVTYGPPQTFKSFFMIHLGYAIAQGVPFFGRKTKQGRVVYIASEGRDGAANRLLAYLVYHGIDIDKTPVPFTIVPTAVNLLDKACARDIVQAIESAGGADMVIIDTLSASMPGGDENTSTDMGLALNHAMTIGHSLDAFVMLVHHTGKDKSRGPRGWSGAVGNVDVTIFVDKSEVDPNVRLAVSQKIREGSVADNTFAFESSPVPLYTDEDGDRVTSLVIRPCAVPIGLFEDRPDKGPKLGPNQKAILNAAGTLTVDQASTPAAVIDLAFERMSEEARALKTKEPRRREVAEGFRRLIDRGLIRLSVDGQEVLQ